jgi:hypothetical protein
MTFSATQKEISELCDKNSEIIVKNIWMSVPGVMKFGCASSIFLPQKITDTINDWRFKVLLDGKFIGCSKWEFLTCEKSNKFYRYGGDNINEKQLKYFDNDSDKKKIQFLAYKFQETPEKKPETQMDIILKELKEMKNDIELLNQKVDDCI